jgi:hypothetical protein
VDNATLELSLDAAHDQAQQAHLDRNVEAYMACFTRDLSYRQADGKVIGWEQLSRDVESQLRRIAASVSTFQRRSLRALSKGAEEELVQTAWGCATAFGLLHRIWHLERNATYSWVVQDGVWRINAVYVASERLSHAGWRFGPRPTLPPVAA